MNGNLRMQIGKKEAVGLGHRMMTGALDRFEVFKHWKLLFRILQLF